MTRILVINPNCSETMTATIRRSATGAAPADTQLEVVSTPGAPAAIDTAEDERAAVTAMLASPAIPTGSGTPDVVVVACFGDPGVEEIGERTGVPVIGIARTTLDHAAATYGTFGILAASEGAVGLMTDLVDRYRLSSACVGVGAIGVGVAALDADLWGHWDRITQAAERLVASGADCLCLGCSGLGPVAERLSAAVGRPVLDPVSIAVRHAVSFGGAGTHARRDIHQGPPVRHLTAPGDSVLSLRD